MPAITVTNPTGNITASGQGSFTVVNTEATNDTQTNDTGTNDTGTNDTGTNDTGTNDTGTIDVLGNISLFAQFESSTNDVSFKPEYDAGIWDTGFSPNHGLWDVYILHTDSSATTFNELKTNPPINLQLGYNYTFTTDPQWFMFSGKNFGNRQLRFYYILPGSTTLQEHTFANPEETDTTFSFFVDQFPSSQLYYFISTYENGTWDEPSNVNEIQTQKVIEGPAENSATSGLNFRIKHNPVADEFMNDAMLDYYKINAGFSSYKKSNMISLYYQQ